MRELVPGGEGCPHGRARASPDFHPLLPRQPRAWPQTLLWTEPDKRYDSLRQQTWLLGRAASRSPGRQRYAVVRRQVLGRAAQTLWFDPAAHVCPSAATSYIDLSHIKHQIFPAKNGLC